MLYAVAGAVYSTPCRYRALHICWIRTPNLRHDCVEALEALLTLERRNLY